ncbi:MAG: HlyD family efflux transporter periplasmic adaptor subunit [Saprospiraceae bacterium]|nr:HlyD family efflux transporter periplasmic adaptor subunit [Saprospiraceae bacterium]
MTQDEKEHIKINQPEIIQSILGKPPSSITNYGIGLVGFAFFILLLLASWVSYPDVVQAPIVINRSNPPIKLLPKVQGRITKIYFGDKSSVNKGDVLASIEHEANLENLDELKALLSKIENFDDPKEILDIETMEDMHGGELQAEASDIMLQIQILQQELKETIVFKKIKSLEQEIAQTKKLNLSMLSQEKIFSQELSNIQKDFTRAKKLNFQGVISNADLEKSESAFLSQKRQLESMKSGRLTNEVRIEQLNTQIITLQQERRTSVEAKWKNLKQTAQNMESSLSKWQNTFQIKAPISGQLSFGKVWYLEQFITTQDEYCAIIPNRNADKPFAYGELGFAGSGKVKVGQICNIALDGFPVQEYGLIKGKLAEIALLPTKESYQIKIALPDTLMTTYKKIIPFRPESKGTVTIVTEDKSILGRIFDQMRNVLKNK